MCVVSMVFDHYDRIIPHVPWAPPGVPSPYSVDPPEPVIPTAPLIIGPTSADLAEARRLEASLRALIAEFREAVAAARTVDRLTGQPDCEDPAKAKLEERVATLEKRLDALTPKPRARKASRPERRA